MRLGSGPVLGGGVMVRIELRPCSSHLMRQHHVHENHSGLGSRCVAGGEGDCRALETHGGRGDFRGFPPRAARGSAYGAKKPGKKVAAGFDVIPADGRVVTAELVRRLRDETEDA